MCFDCWPSRSMGYTRQYWISVVWDPALRTLGLFAERSLVSADTPLSWTWRFSRNRACVFLKTRFDWNLNRGTCRPGMAVGACLGRTTTFDNLWGGLSSHRTARYWWRGLHDRRPARVVEDYWPAVNKLRTERAQLVSIPNGTVAHAVLEKFRELRDKNFCSSPGSLAIGPFARSRTILSPSN